MGKKNKKEKKGKGKEKTAVKTEKKAEKRAKRELADLGEEEIKKQLSDYQDKLKDRTEVIEEKCPPPSPRSSISLTPHPDKEELFIFGGEYYTGKSMTLYDELFVYNIKKNEWTKITAPNSPPPRSSHQAVSLSQSGGQLWIFGGEFSSHSQSQFYHYKDLWVYHIKPKQWQMIRAPGGPSSRSGHRMIAWKKMLIVFGGFHDNLREYKYFNDLYMFDVENYCWTRITTAGIPPSPRSGCVLTVNQDTGRLVVYGGFCKERVKKDEDVGTSYTDLHALIMEGKGENMKWKWTQMKQSGSQPSKRCGVSATVAPGNRAVLFGGVYDKADMDDDDDGIFYNEMYSLDTNTGKWNDVIIRGKKTATERKKRRKNKEEEIVVDAEDCLDELQLNKHEDIRNEEERAMETDSSVFTVKIGPQTSKSDLVETVSTELFQPSARMNCALCVKGSVLYLYGGLVEDKEKQITLADFYSLDLQKLDEWNIIIPEDKSIQVWEESEEEESEEEESDEEDDGEEGAEGGDEESSESSDDDSDEEDISFDDAPKKTLEETIKDYFQRCKEYWMTKAKEIFEDESSISVTKMESLAYELCKKALSDVK